MVTASLIHAGVKPSQTAPVLLVDRIVQSRSINKIICLLFRASRNSIRCLLSNSGCQQFRLQIICPQLLASLCKLRFFTVSRVEHLGNQIQFFRDRCFQQTTFFKCLVIQLSGLRFQSLGISGFRFLDFDPRPFDNQVSQLAASCIHPWMASLLFNEFAQQVLCPVKHRISLFKFARRARCNHQCQCRFIPENVTHSSWNHATGLKAFQILQSRVVITTSS